MAKYTQRSDGRFFTLVNTGNYDDDGKPIRIPVYATSSKKLETAVAEIKYELNKGIYANDKGFTLKQYAIQWLDTYKKSKEFATYEKYQNIIKNHMDIIGNIKLQELRKSDVQNQINNAMGKYETQRIIKMTVVQILDCAIDDGLVYKNVARKVELPRKEYTQKNRVLTEPEKIAIKACKDNHIFTDKERFFIDTLYVTGMRPEEILALHKGSFILNDNKVSVTNALTWKGGKRIKDTKSKSGIRTIDVPTWYIEEAKSFLKSIHTFYIFTGTDGQLISQSTYRTFWHSIFQKINVQMGGTPDVYYGNKYHKKGLHVTDLTPYVFRHNYATMLYYLNIDLKEASRMMGHSNIKIMLEVYTHLENENKKVLDKIESIVL